VKVSVISSATSGVRIQAVGAAASLQYTVFTMSIGAVLRGLRKDARLTLGQLANESGLSASFLSQVERNVCSPSLASLERISGALGLPLTTLLSLQGDGISTTPDATIVSPIIHKGAGFQLQLGAGAIRYEHLTIKFSEPEFEVITHNIPAGHQSDIRTHTGDEFGYVLQGEIILTVGEHEYRLIAGDAYQIRGRDPHGYGAPKESPGEVLVVSTRKFIEWYETTGTKH
jgi:transcriptional regulator with XRE-family HTH domain